MFRGGLFMLLIERLRWERIRWVLLLALAHLIFGARSGLYDDTRSIRQLRRFMDYEQLSTPLGVLAAICFVGALGLLILFLMYDDD